MESAATTSSCDSPAACGKVTGTRIEACVTCPGDCLFFIGAKRFIPACASHADRVSIGCNDQSLQSSSSTLTSRVNLWRGGEPETSSMWLGLQSERSFSRTEVCATSIRGQKRGDEGRRRSEGTSVQAVGAGVVKMRLRPVLRTLLRRAACEMRSVWRLRRCWPPTGESSFVLARRGLRLVCLTEYRNTTLNRPKTSPLPEREIPIRLKESG